jgi:hypothetical protein
MPIAPNVAFNDLTNNVTGFLKKYPVRIFGATAASGVVAYCLKNRGASFRPGSVLGTLSMKATESFDIRAMAAIAAVGGVGNGQVFNAHSVHMDLNQAAMHFYNLDNAGPNIMVTGQLSGCSFVMRAGAAGSVDVAHVSPAGTTGALLIAALQAAFPAALIYGVGSYDSNDRVVSILGVRGGTGWRIFAQKHDATSGDYRIKSVYQIWPARLKL